MEILTNYCTHKRVFAFCLLACSLLFFMSCASLKPRLNGFADEDDTILEIEHLHSKSSSDCLERCVDMVLQYYGVEVKLPDASLPLEMMALTQHLNDEMLTDDQGYRLFATVLPLSSEEMAAQLICARPLILIYKPHSQKVYHSIVISGYSPERDRYFTYNPIRKKPSWIRLTKITEFDDGEKYLIMMLGLYSS